MRAWIVDRPSPVDQGPLRLAERDPPEPGNYEVRVRVSVCGVCRTDLHVVEGDLPPHRVGVVPGHEIVGVVDAVGPGASRFELGDRVGIAWLRWTCGICRFCRRGDENLCLTPRFTGWDDDGGFAEFATVHEDYAYVLPASLPDEKAAPLLCAGIIGYRALRRSNLRRGGALGIYGFGASAHLAAQVAMFEGATVHVMTRSAEARQLALDLGVASAQESEAAPPEPLDAAILFAPVGTLVPPALAGLDRGGTLSVAGIYLTDVPPLSYQTHLFEERALVSVTANTRQDGEALLALATEIPIQVITTGYRLDEAPRALSDLAGDRVSGAAVLDCRVPAPVG
jgi:propanol-preferring alcohol dehydrogenase